MTEKWRPVPGWKHYETSDLGRVRSVERRVSTARGSRSCPATILAQRIDRYGYLRVNLTDGRRRWTAPVHQLVAMSFHGERPSTDLQVAHWDGNRTNNRADNLRWATACENNADQIRHGTRLLNRRGAPKLTPTQVNEIRSALRRGARQRRLAERYNVCPQTICNIALGRTFQWVAEGDSAEAS